MKIEGKGRDYYNMWRYVKLKNPGDWKDDEFLQVCVHCLCHEVLQNVCCRAASAYEVVSVRTESDCLVVQAIRLVVSAFKYFVLAFAC